MRDRAWWILVVLNGLVATSSGVFGVLGLLSAGALTGRPAVEPPSEVAFFAAMYAVRAVSLAIAVLVALMRTSPGRIGPLLPLLALAGVVQLGDVVIAAANRTPGVAGASVAAIIHLGSLIVLARWSTRRATGNAG